MGRKSLMDRQIELGIIRAAYAKQILAAAGVVNDPRLEAALGAVRREDFLGAGPWPIMRWFRDRDYVTTPDADPVYLYSDDLVGILPERHLNNGQPSLHAHLVHQASPAAGEHVVHIGTGTGYYTALLAHLAGSSGRITGIEYEPELAARAKANFAGYPNVEIIEGDGTSVSFDQADVIYVNAGCTRPAPNWLDRLAARCFESSGAVMTILRDGFRPWRSFPAPEAATRHPNARWPKLLPKEAGSRSRGSIATKKFPRSVAGSADPDGASPPASIRCKTASLSAKYRGPQNPSNVLIRIKFWCALEATLLPSIARPKKPIPARHQTWKRSKKVFAAPGLTLRFGSCDGLQQILQYRPQPPA
jgi:protein-L-isoaspartate O-methyltransferase